MRLNNLNDVDKLGDRAKKQIYAALGNEKIPIKRRFIEADISQTQSPKQPASPSPKSRVMKLPDGARYCPWPSPDPAVVVHQLLEKAFGSYWYGGKVVSEMIIEGGEKAWRFDWVILNECGAMLAVEMDGFQFHRTLDAFKNDRKKQTHALKSGFLLHRITNEDIRERTDEIIPNIERILDAHNSNQKRDFSLQTKGKTQCVFSWVAKDESTGASS